MDVSAKHTPGPWIDREGTTTGAEVFGKKPRGGDYVVARCGGKDRAANARLIAAAPDLLAAAKTVMAGLNARIDAGSVSGSVPVFDGIADLHAAIARTESSHD